MFGRAGLEPNFTRSQTSRNTPAVKWVTWYKIQPSDWSIQKMLQSDWLRRIPPPYTTDIGEMSVSQRRGVITLLPKEDSNLLLLSNWRPITLLNTDYKIASKVIAKRIERILPSVIHPDQTGFMKGRSIGHNIRLINDIIQQTELQKIPGILLFLDFQKAFIQYLRMVIYPTYPQSVQLW